MRRVVPVPVSSSVSFNWVVVPTDEPLPNMAPLVNPIPDLIVDAENIDSDFVPVLRTDHMAFGSIDLANLARLEIDPASTPTLQADDVTISGGSVMSTVPRALGGLHLLVENELQLEGGSEIAVGGRGLLGAGNSTDLDGDGEEDVTSLGDDGGTYGGPDGTTPVSGSIDGSGGSFGGDGGGGDANAVYGIEQNPAFLGSGGSRTAGSGGRPRAHDNERWIREAITRRRHHIRREHVGERPD